jgi:hypothetical protein
MYYEGCFIFILFYFVPVSYWIAYCIFEQAFKTPSPKPEKSLLSSLFGGGSGQKKAHVSFGVNKSTTYTPPDSDGCNTPNAWNQ